MSNVAVSHTGVTPLAERYGPLTVGALHAFISNTAVGPELSMRSGILHGQLTLDLQTLDSDMDRAGMTRVADDIVATLSGAAES